MSQFEHEERCRLESELRSAEDELDVAIQSRKGDPEAARRRIDAAQAELDVWDRQIIQVSPAPNGMVAVFERRDGLEEHIPVSYLALHRSGRVYPYIFVGNCESILPQYAPNFLRIDHNWMMNGEVSLSEIAHELVSVERGLRKWFG